MRVISEAAESGSSPLARGLPPEAAAVCSGIGIIPARAGFTPRERGDLSWITDHPRSRGVYTVEASGTYRLLGSSPLARGLRSSTPPGARNPWIIPARAGFTRPSCSGNQSGWDHPRSRGVYAAALPGKWVDGGSSPLARGLPGVDNYLVTLDRIIPARAGFTKRDFSQVPGGEDHPRSRGVYFGLGLADPGGSRIIPARAGFTAGTPRSSPWSSDHPRSRGVYRSSVCTPYTSAGSSPLARGLRGASGMAS